MNNNKNNKSDKLDGIKCFQSVLDDQIIQTKKVELVSQMKSDYNPSVHGHDSNLSDQ